MGNSLEDLLVVQSEHIVRERNFSTINSSLASVNQFNLGSSELDSNSLNQITLF